MTEPIFQTIYSPDNKRSYRAWTNGVVWEAQAREQVHRLMSLPFVKDVCVMPDTHFGLGGPVGVAVKFEGAITPAVVGADIGCGMRATLTDIQADKLTPEVLVQLRQAIEETVPHGMTQGGRDKGSWLQEPSDVRKVWFNDHNGERLCIADEYDELIGHFDYNGPTDLDNLEYRLDPLRNGSTAAHRDPLSQLGTLGSGNHFFEVSVDQHGGVWFVVHSGSRGAGARIADYFTKRAQDLMEKWLTKLPDDDKSLAFLPEGTNEYTGYIEFMEWAQGYAYCSRALMMNRVLDIAVPRVLKGYVNVVEDFDIHHNYLDTNTMIARKGAVNLTPGALAVIPGAMGARTYIVTGKEGLKNSMYTCSHGAGRAMSRTQAEKSFTLEQHQAALAGLECNKSEDTLDETTQAYKDVDKVIAAQSDLVEPKYILNAKLCVKGVSLKRHRKNQESK